MKLDSRIIGNIVDVAARDGRGELNMQTAIIQATQYVTFGAYEDAATLRSSGPAASWLRYATNKYSAAAGMLLGTAARLSGRSAKSLVDEACEHLMPSPGGGVVEVFSDTAANRAANSIRALGALIDACNDGFDAVLEDVPHVGRILVECALALHEEVRSLESRA